MHSAQTWSVQYFFCLFFSLYLLGGLLPLNEKSSKSMDTLVRFFYSDIDTLCFNLSVTMTLLMPETCSRHCRVIEECVWIRKEHKKMVPKIGDFRLSRLFGTEQHSVRANSHGEHSKQFRNLTQLSVWIRKEHKNMECSSRVYTPLGPS